MFFEEKAEGILMRVRITPNSSSCLIKGVFCGANNELFLKINLISVPEKGKANKELITLLSKFLKVSKSDIEIVSGDTDRYKKILIKEKSLEIMNKLSQICGDEDDS